MSEFKNKVLEKLTRPTYSMVKRVILQKINQIETLLWGEANRQGVPYKQFLRKTDIEKGFYLRIEKGLDVQTKAEMKRKGNVFTGKALTEAAGSSSATRKAILKLNQDFNESLNRNMLHIIKDGDFSLRKVATNVLREDTRKGAGELLALRESLQKILPKKHLPLLEELMKKNGQVVKLEKAVAGGQIEPEVATILKEGIDIEIKELSQSLGILPDKPLRVQLQGLTDSLRKQERIDNVIVIDTRLDLKPEVEEQIRTLTQNRGPTDKRGIPLEFDDLDRAMLKKLEGNKLVGDLKKPFKKTKVLNEADILPLFPDGL